MKDNHKKFLAEVEEFSSSTLTKKEDLILLLKISYKNGIQNKFEEIAFTGKYVSGLLRVLKKGRDFQEVDSLDHVKKDLTSNIENLINQMEVITDKGGDDIRTYFNETYYKLTGEAFQNLTILAADLDAVKKYLNHQKRKNPN